MSTQAETQSRALEAPRGTGKRNRRNNAGRGSNRNAQSDKAKTTEEIGAVGSAPEKLENDSKEKVADNNAVAVAAPSESGDADVCWICAEPVKYYAVSECNHRTCHVCALRLRALYKKLECTFCKEKQNALVFTKSAEDAFASFQPQDIPHKDARLSIYFETQEMMEDSLLLLRFNCPEQQCDYIGNGWGDLRLHVRATHGKLMCDLCIRHKKVFSHEHALYLPGALPVHLPSMTNRPSKAALKEPVEGGVHPLCEFCRECFFGDDELYAHMRERHEECFICKRNNIVHKYFLNYDALEKHFNTAHHPCTQPDCQARKFVVFNAAIDLKAHMVEEHGADMSSKDRKDARRIQADFAFEEVNAGRHNRRDRDRERDREREPPPPRQQDQAQASSTANAGRPNPPGSRRREAFGGALTEPEGGGPSANTERPIRTSTPQPAADVDPVVAERHAVFLARLQSLAPNPSAAVPAVKAATRSYRFAESSARDLILTIWNVLDRNLEYAASIVNAFVDLLDEDEKKEDLLSSWRGFEVEQRRQFPDLAPASFGSGYAGITSGRVLNAKHATASRSSRTVWDRVAMAAGSSSSAAAPKPAQAQDRFPALASTSSVNTTAATPTFRPPSTGQHKTPWSGNSGAPSTLRVQPRSTGPTSTMASRSSTPKAPPPKLSNSLFPELPSSTTTRTKPEVKGHVSLKNILGSTGPPAVNAWGGSNSGSVSLASDSQDQARGESGTEGGVPATGKGKKAKGKQKQTLFTLGTFPN